MRGQHCARSNEEFEDMSNTRPLSPHLGIYRWRVNMLQSTLHRLTGLFLCLGALLVTWGLVAAATSGAAWNAFAAFCGSWIGLILLFLWTWSLLFHLCNGIQHLIRDMGMNFGPPTRDRAHSPVYWSTGWIVIAVSVALAVLVWVLLILRLGGGAA
jgi:succinate dehydrogenase / fumarate reductase cytochrome b subunit